MRHLPPPLTVRALLVVKDRLDPPGGKGRRTADCGNLNSPRGGRRKNIAKISKCGIEQNSSFKNDVVEEKYCQNK